MYIKYHYDKYEIFLNKNISAEAERRGHLVTQSDFVTTLNMTSRIALRSLRPTGALRVQSPRIVSYAVRNIHAASSALQGRLYGS